MSLYRPQVGFMQFKNRKNEPGADLKSLSKTEFNKSDRPTDRRWKVKEEEALCLVNISINYDLYKNSYDGIPTLPKIL